MFNVPVKIKGITYVQDNQPSNPHIGETWKATGEYIKVFKSSGWEALNTSEEVYSYQPGPGASYGYCCGGEDTSAINRLEFPFDSGTATTVGTLPQQQNFACGLNSKDNGFTAGGKDSDTNDYIKVTNRIAFPFDSGTATQVGSLTEPYTVSPAGCNSSNYGFVIGGYSSNSTINRLEFPFDSGNTTVINNLSSRSSFGSGSGLNSSEHGFSIGGGDTSLIDRIEFPFDSGSSSLTAGTLVAENRYSASCNSSTYGYTTGGFPVTSIIQRILFPFNSGTATMVGSLSRTNYAAAGCNSTNCGFAMGGYYSNSAIEKFNFPFDSGTATVTGNLSVGRKTAAGLDGTDFSSMFV